MKATIIGIDIAKRIFQIHGVDKNGKNSTKEKVDARSGVEFYG